MDHQCLEVLGGEEVLRHPEWVEEEELYQGNQRHLDLRERDFRHLSRLLLKMKRFRRKRRRMCMYLLRLRSRKKKRLKRRDLYKLCKMRKRRFHKKLKMILNLKIRCLKRLHR